MVDIVAARHGILVHIRRGHILVCVGRDHIGGQRMLVIVIARRWGPYCYGIVVRREHHGTGKGQAKQEDQSTGLPRRRSRNKKVLL